MKVSGPLLYDEQGNIFTCERPRWEKCPDHKHLSDRKSMSVVEKDKELKAWAEKSDEGMVDDPDDDIVSVNEYKFEGSMGSLLSRRFESPKLSTVDKIKNWFKRN